MIYVTAIRFWRAMQYGPKEGALDINGPAAMALNYARNHGGYRCTVPERRRRRDATGIRMMQTTKLLGLRSQIGRHATAVLAAPAPLRRAIIGAAIKPGRLIADAATTYPISDVEILNASGASFHPASTCAIGPVDNPMAVVDPRCRVYGVEGLRVADASVMPNIVSANTNMPTIMIGERVAEFIRHAGQ